MSIFACTEKETFDVNESILNESTLIKKESEIPYFNSKTPDNAKSLVLDFLKHTNTFSNNSNSFKTNFTDKSVTEGLWTLEAASNYLVNENFTTSTDSILYYPFNLNSFLNTDGEETLSGDEMVQKFDDLFNYIETAKLSLSCEPLIIDLFQVSRQENTYNLGVALAFGCSSGGTGGTGGNNNQTVNCPPEWPESMLFHWDNLVGEELTEKINACLVTCPVGANQTCEFYEGVTIFDLNGQGLTEDYAYNKDCYPDCGLFWFECDDSFVWTSETITEPLYASPEQIRNFPFQADRTINFAEYIISNPSEFDFPLLDGVYATHEIDVREIVTRSEAIFPAGPPIWLTTLESIIVAKGNAY